MAFNDNNNLNEEDIEESEPNTPDGFSLAKSAFYEKYKNNVQSEEDRKNILFSISAKVDPAFNVSKHLKERKQVLANYAVQSGSSVYAKLCKGISMDVIEDESENKDKSNKKTKYSLKREGEEICTIVADSDSIAYDLKSDKPEDVLLAIGELVNYANKRNIKILEISKVTPKNIELSLQAASKAMELGLKFEFVPEPPIDFSAPDVPKDAQEYYNKFKNIRDSAFDNNGKMKRGGKEIINDFVSLKDRKTNLKVSSKLD